MNKKSKDKIKLEKQIRTDFKKLKKEMPDVFKWRLIQMTAVKYNTSEWKVNEALKNEKTN